MKNFKIILLFIILIGGSSCQEEASDPIINYYVSFKPNSTIEIEKFEILFTHTRAHQKDQDGEYIRSVYLDSQDIVYYSNSSNSKIFLGSSSIGTDSIIAYDFGFGEQFITVNGEKSKYKILDYSESNKSFTNIKLNPNEVLDLTFEIDLQNGIVELIDNEFKFLEKANIIK